MVSREVRRNGLLVRGRYRYRALAAQVRAEERARRPKPAKLAVNGEHCCDDPLNPSGRIGRGGRAAEHAQHREIGES